MINDVKKTAEQKMGKSIDALKHDFAKIRTGRAHTGLLDHGPRRLLRLVDAVEPGGGRHARRRAHDRRAAVEKKMIPVVEKAIRDQRPRVNPATSGDVIRSRCPR
jgi:ribosome recycling factor